MALLTAIATTVVRAQFRLKMKCDPQYCVGLMEFSRHNLRLLIFWSIIGGICAGALGIGGGLIYNPLLLSLAIPPKVTSATSMYMVFYAALSSVIVYGVSGQLYYEYAGWFALLTIIGVVLGLYVIGEAIKKTGRNSIIVIILGIIIGLASVLVPVLGGLNLAESAEHNVDIYEFHNPC